MRTVCLLLLVSAAAFAGGTAAPVNAPEIDASTATAALALLTGGVAVLRGRRRRK